MMGGSLTLIRSPTFIPDLLQVVPVNPTDLPITQNLDPGSIRRGENSTDGIPRNFFLRNSTVNMFRRGIKIHVTTVSYQNTWNHTGTGLHVPILSWFLRVLHLITQPNVYRGGILLGSPKGGKEGNPGCEGNLVYHHTCNTRPGQGKQLRVSLSKS